MGQGRASQGQWATWAPSMTHMWPTVHELLNVYIAICNSKTVIWRPADLSSMTCSSIQENLQSEISSKLPQ